MFEPSKSDRPASKWVKALSRFFKKHNLDVMSHDFRATFATDLYNSGKDPVKV